MYALIFHDKGNEDQKEKFKTFEEAVEAACGIIVPQISEAVELEIESSEEVGKAVQPRFCSNAGMNLDVGRAPTPTKP